MWHPTKEAVRQLWGRRWVRRISYGVVAGATALTLGPWLLNRPAALQWVARRLDRLVREETGLSLAIGYMEFHPTLGTLVLKDVRLGDDLLTIRRMEIQADVWSFLGPNQHLHAIRIEHPQVRLTEAGLAALHLKSHAPRTGPLPQVQLDLFSLTDGNLLVPVAMRGIPELQYAFSMKATGLGPNHVRVDLAGPQLTVKGPEGLEKGRFDLNGEVSEQALAIREGYLRLGESQVRFKGGYEAAKGPAAERLEAQLTGLLDLGQASHWGGSTGRPIGGRVNLKGSVQGSLTHPNWTLAADGQDLSPGMNGFLPGDLDLRATGGLDHGRLDRLQWNSTQGELVAQGHWSRKTPIEFTVQGRNLDLDALGRALRLPTFQDARGTIQAQVKSIRARDALGRLDGWQASLKAGFSQHGHDAGGLDASLDKGRAVLERLRLDLDSLKLDGSGWASLGPRSLVQMEGEGRIQVDASQVAQVLKAWKVVSLDMDGQTIGEAKVRWSRSNGLVLDGNLEVDRPRWHGARADHLQAKVVEIRGSDLRVKDIVLIKGEGRGGGDLWLTWAHTAPGQPQMDMCYTAFRLPVAEGLKAADLKDSVGHDLPLEGTGSGWVRLVGPYDHLVMTGAAQAESSDVYGITVPAVSSDFWMDLPSLRLKLSDVRIGERLDLLGRGDTPPEGALALTGQADMDFEHRTWWVELGGRLDSQLIALPGPRIQAQVEARLLGPITSPFGGLDLPGGRIQFTRGRIFFSDRSVEGIEGAASLDRGHLDGHLGMTNLKTPLVEFQVRQEGLDLAGNLQLNISPESAHTDLLARGLTDDLLEDLRLSATVQGRWRKGRDLVWKGSLDQLAAEFGAFELHQAGPSSLQGNARGMAVDMALEGGGRGAQGANTPQAAHIRLSGQVPFLGAEAMAIRAQGTADLAHMKSILDRVMEVDDYSMLSGLSVQGTSRFDILAHGTYLDPLLDGKLSLEKGQMSLRGYQGAEDIQAEVVLKDRTLTVSEDHPVQGTLAHGELKASGAMSWRLGGIDRYAIQASLANFQLRDVPEGLDLQGSLQATLNGTEEGGVLKGRLHADRLNYQTEVKLADLILRNALNESGGLSGLDLDDPLERIRLDLDLDLRTPWRFDTNLLKLEGRTDGPFQVLGTLAHPIPKGTMLFQPGGRVTNIFPAGDMVVEAGTLTFSESRPLDPLINLRGNISSIPGYTVNLDIRGTLSNLNIVPSSTPSLRQDEIVAILINPGNVANVGTAGASSGATQGAITQGIASASYGLISTLAFAPFQDQLRRTLGLDRVNVAVRSTTLGNTETEVTLGKNLNLLGPQSAFVISHKKSSELSITSGQMEWRFGNLILQFGETKGTSTGLSGEIRYTWTMD